MTAKCDLCGSQARLLEILTVDSDGEYVKVFRCGECRDEIRKMLGEQYGIPPIDWVKRNREEWHDLMEFQRQLQTRNKSAKELRKW
jgi:hypothetical protein